MSSLFSELGFFRICGFELPIDGLSAGKGRTAIRLILIESADFLSQLYLDWSP